MPSAGTLSEGWEKTVIAGLPGFIKKRITTA